MGAKVLNASANAAADLFAAVVRGLAKRITGHQPVHDTEPVEHAAYLEQHPSVENLAKAIGRAAKDLGGEVTESWRDCNDHDHECLCAIRTAKMPRGVGVTVASDGAVKFVYDAHQADTTAAKEVQNAVTTHYNVMAATQFLKSEGYQVDVQPQDGPSGAVVLSVLGQRQH